jgi:hypothetical protein
MHEKGNKVVHSKTGYLITANCYASTRQLMDAFYSIYTGRLYKNRVLNYLQQNILYILTMEWPKRLKNAQFQPSLCFHRAKRCNQKSAPFAFQIFSKLSILLHQLTDSPLSSA